MASINLTSGAIDKIAEGLAELQPVLQVLDVRLVNTQQSAAERYRMVLSDGIHNLQAMLATQMNGIVKSGFLQRGSIVKLFEFICNTIQNRRIIIVINLEVLVEKADVIGEPMNYDAVVHCQEIFPDSPQHSFETSTILQQESAVNNQSAEISFSDAGQNITSLNLTRDAISKIFEGVGDNKLQPILQVVDMRMVNARHSAVERYRVILSDSAHQLQGILGTQLNCLIKSGQLQKGSIIQLNEFVCSAIHSHRFLVIINLQVLNEKANVIGSPTHFDAATQPGNSIEDYVGDQIASLCI